MELMSKIKPEDISVETFNIGGARFPNMAGVRITHHPSGEQFASSISRSQYTNRNNCINQLKAYLESWDLNPVEKKIKYIIKAAHYHDAMEIAKSHGLGPSDVVPVSFKEDCDSVTGLPRGFRPDLSICTLSQRASKTYTLKKAHNEWHKFLFELISEEKKQKFFDHVANTLDGFLWCDRVWSAWSVGTMTQEDFGPAGDDPDVIYEHAVSMYIMFLEMQK